jgi:hypothetical protein
MNEEIDIVGEKGSRKNPDLTSVLTELKARGMEPLVPDRQEIFSSMTDEELKTLAIERGVIFSR